MNELDWLAGGGECGKLIRSMDWSKNSLGPIENWPQSLKTAVSLCLSSTFPINIVWGPDHIQIYNDAYRPICGAYHPASMGSMFKVLWASALPVVGGAFDRGLQGEGTYIPNQRMFLERYGYLEEAFMTFSFSPIRDESGNVGGIFHPISESTEKMLSSRRTQVVRDLGIQINKAQSLPEMYKLALDSQKDFDLDLPFMIFFEINQQTNEPELKAFSGLEEDSSLLDVGKWNLDSIYTSSRIDNLGETFGAFKSGSYERSPDSAIALPIYNPGGNKPILYVVAGVSSAREVDADYLSFYDLLKNTITTAVTNIRAYEEEQKRAQALAQIDKAKTAFFSNVSHEFRTPLTLMIGPLEDSLNDMSDPLSPSQRSRLELVHRNSQRLLKLVNSLLDFSRIEAGRIEANFEPVDLASYTMDLASVFRSTVESAGLKFVINCKSLPEAVYVDREMWEKIILNLLSNAYKFTFEGGITVSCEWKNDGAVISVDDTGIGVSQEEVPRLFERFHRVHGAKSRTYEGSGIGLALVYELVKMHGGEISATSEQGKGTKFEIFIPKGTAHLENEKVVEPKKLESTSISASAYIQEAQMWADSNNTPVSETLGSNKTIVLADDNTDMRNYVASILGQHWKVYSAKDGQEAYEMASRIKPDLILTDVMMPVLDGFGLLKKIREDHSLRSVPTILLSARAGEEAKVEGLKAGADDYLIKPFSARELVSKIHAILKMNTLRFETSKELALNAEKFRSTFSHATVNIAMLSLDGTILEINNAFLTKTGYSEAEVIGKDFSIVTHPEDVESNKHTLEKLGKGEILSATFEKRYVKKDQTHFWVKTSVSSALGPDGKPLYLIAVSQDIDAIKLSESKYMNAVKELEEEKEMREKFVATLTHDLRTPMTSAKMSAQLIQRRPEVFDSVQSQAARIVNNVNRADKMIQNLLDANRIQAGEKLPLEIEALDIDDIILESLDNFVTLFGDRFEYFSDGKIRGYWSHSGISRILDNLINNAIKYGESNGKIKITVNRRESFFEFAVHNFGNPLSEEDQKTIFDAYKRSKDADGGRQKGWGLGLTLVRGVTEAMGGQVFVESSPSLGTSFRIQLPIDAREAYSRY